MKQRKNQRVKLRDMKRKKKGKREWKKKLESINNLKFMSNYKENCNFNWMRKSY